MSFYNNYTNDFNIQTKGKRILPNPNDELICNNCINQDLIDAKKRHLQLQNARNETPMDVQDRLNKLNQTQINNRVQDRIKLSENVAKKMRPNTSIEKDKLIKTNENGVFFLNDPNIISNDYQKQRALDNYNKRALRTSASSVACKGNNNNDKPEVDKYYKKYVDNYKEPDNNSKLRSSRSMPRNNYNEELNKQIEDKNRLRNKRDQEEQERMNNEQRKDYEKFLNKQNEENKKRQRMNEDFIQGNKNLIYLKNKKKENEINKTYEDDYKKAMNVQKELEDEIIKKKNEDNKKKMELQKELEKQMKEKEMRKAIEKEEYKCVPNSTIGSCTCQGTGVCSQCKKTYPLNFLNTKKNYKSLAQARYERKKSNKNNIKY